MPKKAVKKTKRWSQRVTTTSDAMDIDAGTFSSDDPERIARAVEKDAEKSTRLKSTPYRSAMSMLTFYINRAGRNLTDEHRKVLEAAKDVLRDQFGPAAAAKPAKAPANVKASKAKPAAALKKGTSRKKTAPRRQAKAKA